MLPPENKEPTVWAVCCGAALALLVVFVLYGLSVEACRVIREAADKIQP